MVQMMDDDELFTYAKDSTVSVEWSHSTSLFARRLELLLIFCNRQLFCHE